jgi:hypothetical protein
LALAASYAYSRADAIGMSLNRPHLSRSEN